MLKILSHPFCNTKIELENEDVKQTKHGILPTGCYDQDFAKKAIKAKSLLNAEFMQSPMISDVAIVWFHKGLASHVGLSVDDKPSGFLSFTHTPEPKSLKKSIEKRVQGIQGRCSAITVQYVKISPLQKRKIEQILVEENFPCVTCMHAVSRILAKAMNIHIPPLLSLSPDTSLIYLQKMQQQGEKTLLEQKTFGTLIYEKESCDDLNRAFEALAMGLISYLMSSVFDLSKTSKFYIMLATSLAVLYKIHLVMRTSS